LQLSSRLPNCRTITIYFLRLFLCVGSLFLLFGARLLLEDWQRLDAGRLVLQQARDEESALGRAIYSKFTQPRVATFLELFKLRK